MAYKYKLAKSIKEDKLGSAQDLSNVGLTPEEFNFLGQNVDFEARKKYVTTPAANTSKSQELKDIIYYSLEDAGFNLDQIKKYMKFLNIERSRNVGGKNGNTPLNEKDEDDSMKTASNNFMKTASNMAQIGNLDYDEEQERSNRKLGNTPMNDKERKMTPEEYREYRKREKLEEIKEMVMTKLKEGKPCWKGYEQIGMKEKDGRQVPNCVPKKR